MKIIYCVSLIAITSLVSSYQCNAESSYSGNIPSLKNYQTADWFRDAKFGIYLHWGAYSVAERGEWYARKALY